MSLPLTCAPWALHGKHALPWHPGHSPPGDTGESIPHSHPIGHRAILEASSALSATINTISSQTRNRCSCCLLIRQPLKPRGSGIAGPGVGAHPFAKDKDNREHSFYERLQGIRVFSAPTEEQTHTPAPFNNSLSFHHTLPHRSPASSTAQKHTLILRI